MTLPLSNLVVAALAVGGLATGVSTASAGAPSPKSAAIAAELAQEQQLRADISGLTDTEQHLRTTLRSRSAESPVEPQGGASTPVQPLGTPDSGPAPAGTSGPPSTVAPSPGRAGTWAPPPSGGGSPSGPSVPGEPATTVPTSPPPAPTTTTTEPTQPTTTTTTQPFRGDDGGGD